METASLLKRRQEVIDRHKLQESVQESPLSPSHRDMKHVDGSAKVLHSERPVAIQDDDVICLVGDCVQKVLSSLKDWLDKTSFKEGEEAIKKYALKVVARVVAKGGDTLEMTTREWNACLYALGEEGMDVVLTGV